MLTNDFPGPLEMGKSITVRGELRTPLHIRKLCPVDAGSESMEA